MMKQHFQRLLDLYESSILKTCLHGDDEFQYGNASQEEIHASSRMSPGDYTTDRMTYSWLSEVRFRNQTLDFLVEHEILDMSNPEHRWPTLDVPKHELNERLSAFKRDGLHLLYRLSDSGAEHFDILDENRKKSAIRRRQGRFLDEELSVSDLAALGTIVEVMGQGFFNITNSALHRSGLLNATVRPLPQLSELQLTNKGIQFNNLSSPSLYRPTSVPIQDLNNQHWIRECMCVFEDLLQQYGPCFAYAYVDGWKSPTRRPDMWARIMLQKGLDAMAAYELGHTMSFASLQSVVWKVFCRKAGCTGPESWERARELVEGRMSGYQLNGLSESVVSV